MSDFIWLHNPETDGYFRCPLDAAEAWKRRGWKPCDPPPERDTTKDPGVTAEPIPALPAEEKPALPTRSTRRMTAAATEVKE